MKLNLQEQKKRLLLRKQELEERLKNLGEIEERETMASSIGELSSYDNHPADLGSEMFERSKDLALRDNVQLLLTEVQEALQKIEDGTYGNCSQCGRAIPRERIKALPAVNLCLRCQSQVEQSEYQTRPIEEKVIAPPFGGQYSNLEEQNQSRGTGVDGEDIWQEVARFGEHAPGSGSGAYYGDLDLDETRGSVEVVEEIPFYKGSDGIFYEDNRG